MFVFDAMNSSRLTAEYVRTLREGAVDGLHASIVWANEGFRETVERLVTCRRELATLAADVALASTVSDLRRAKSESRIGVVLGIQNSTATEDNLDLLDALRHLGVRIVQLTYNERNRAGDGCTERRDAGLSDFGVMLVHRLNALRLAIDVSHAGERTLMDALSTSRAPIICSHANLRAVCDSPRNLSDAALSALASKGGVLGITSFGAFVRDTSPSLEHILDHIDHAARLVGTDHVGLGSDLFEGRDLDVPIDGRTYKPSVYRDARWSRAQGLESAADIPRLIDGLKRRRYTASEIDGIMGENFLRVLDEIWGSGSQEWDVAPDDERYPLGIRVLTPVPDSKREEACPSPTTYP